MNDNHLNQEAIRTFQLMNEIEDGTVVSQRELAGRLGVAVGLVNSYLKNLVAKGYVRVKNYPRNRYAYLLTPKGFAEKGRLAFQHLDYFTGLYTTTRRGYQDLFQLLKAEGVKELIFCGVDEVAEIAYLSLKEVGIPLQVVMDDVNGKTTLFDHPVVDLVSGLSASDGPIVITSLKRQDFLRKMLVGLDVPPERVKCIHDLSVAV